MIKNNLLEVKRNSFMEFGELYFWTATINQWQHLLRNDSFRIIILNSLEYLSSAGKVNVYAFVIMPNHIHLIWKINEFNGKESPQGSFLKYTAHEFKKYLKMESPHSLAGYAVHAQNKSFEFWQRDPLAVRLFSKDMAFQKLDYVHYNPTVENGYCLKSLLNILIHPQNFMKQELMNLYF